MSFPLALKVKEGSENALLQQVEDAAGKRLWRVRLDGFQGDMGVHCGLETGGKFVPSSEAYLSEKYHGVLKELRYNWKHDGYDFHDIWVVKGKIIQPHRDELQNVVCALHIEYGGVHMGHGDGYHRAFDERPFVTVKRITVPILAKAIAKETVRVKREDKEWKEQHS